jgi:hypothetical protein
MDPKTYSKRNLRNEEDNSGKWQHVLSRMSKFACASYLSLNCNEGHGTQNLLNSH